MRISILHPDTKRDEAAAEWAMRLSDGPLSPLEETSLDHWLTEEQNRAALADAVSVWRGMDSVATIPEVVGFRAAALDTFRRANASRWAAPAFRRPWQWAAVAMIVLIFMSAALIYAWSPVRHATGTGERQVAVLKDGSRISLDGATKVDVDMDDDRRALTIVSGRARFTVAPDALRPFRVTAGDKVIIATGTSFSVEIVGRDVRVVLYEGHVNVVDTTGTPVQVLTGSGGTRGDALLVPGRELVTTLGALAAHVVSANSIRSGTWEAGRLNFDDEPLALAVARMNRQARTPMRIIDPAIGRLRVSGVFAATDGEAFAEAVATILPVAVAHRNGAVELSLPHAK